METLAIATEIKNQIGNKALFMIGAHNVAGGKNYLSFKIKGSKKVNHIKIELTSMDDYTMTFSKYNWSKGELKSSVEHTGVYCDMIHDMIEKETGLYTRL